MGMPSQVNSILKLKLSQGYPHELERGWKAIIPLELNT